MALAFPKPSRTARKKATHETRQSRRRDEVRVKAIVRRLDRVCRFPLCGCKKVGGATCVLESSHLEHKGMGGDKDGHTSDARNLLLLCAHRHRYGAVSRHRGTLRWEPLTDQGCRGPVRWLVDGSLLRDSWPGWAELARDGESPNAWQRRQLIILAAMND